MGREKVLATRAEAWQAKGMSKEAKRESGKAGRQVPPLLTHTGIQPSPPPLIRYKGVCVVQKRVKRAAHLILFSRAGIFQRESALLFVKRGGVVAGAGTRLETGAGIAPSQQQ